MTEKWFVKEARQSRSSTSLTLRREDGSYAGYVVIFDKLELKTTELVGKEVTLQT